MRLIPSLGCLVKFKSETSVVPTKVIAVPSADKIYPKHGIIHIGLSPLLPLLSLSLPRVTVPDRTPGLGTQKMAYCPHLGRAAAEREVAARRSN